MQSRQGDPQPIGQRGVALVQMQKLLPPQPIPAKPSQVKPKRLRLQQMLRLIPRGGKGSVQFQITSSSRATIPSPAHHRRKGIPGLWGLSGNVSLSSSVPFML
jgi:hypothetical protein